MRSSLVPGDKVGVILPGNGGTSRKVIGILVEQGVKRSVVALPACCPEVQGEAMAVPIFNSEEDAVQNIVLTSLLTEHLQNTSAKPSLWAKAMEMDGPVELTLLQKRANPEKLASTDSEPGEQTSGGDLLLGLRSELLSQKSAVAELANGQKELLRAMAAKANQSSKEAQSSNSARRAGGPFATHSHLWEKGPAEDEDEDEEEEESEGENPLEPNGRGKGSGGSVDQLVQLEILKTLKSMQKPQKKDSVDSDSEAEGDGSSSKFKQLGKLHAQHRKNPKANVLQYREWAMKMLGAREGVPWRYQHVGHKVKIQFGKMRGLYRVYEELLNILETMESGKNVNWKAASDIVQLLKAIHQCALDRGEWSVACHLLESGDILSQPSFGATERELECIQSYRKGLRDLKDKKQWQHPKDGDKDEDEDGEPKPKKKGK